MRRLFFALYCVVPTVALMGATPARAQDYGSLANFDSVNDTVEVAHGFEIEIDDPSFDRSKLSSIFGLDRNFGVPPASVERYGAPSIFDLPGVGVRLRYAATFANGAWSVGTYGTPLKTTYNWLIDPGNTGTLSKRLANLPAVNFVLQAAPAPGAPQPVVAEIEAHKADGELFGTPYWVKTLRKHVDHNVKLDDLVKHHADVPGDAEVEVEFEIFQAGDLNGRKDAALALNPGDAALVVRYEFYRYVGALTPEGETDCGGHGVQKSHRPIAAAWATTWVRRSLASTPWGRRWQCPNRVSPRWWRWAWWGWPLLGAVEPTL